MATRIIFNGKEYASPDAMPDEVRKQYQQALAQLEDADHNGIPDVAEKPGGGTVIGIQNSAITFNGKTYESVEQMPALARFLFRQVMGQLEENAGALPSSVLSAQARSATGPALPEPPNRNDGFFRILDGAEQALSTILFVVLGAGAGAVLVFGIWMIRHMDPGSRSQGGVFYVGLGMLVILGWIAAQFVGLIKRRR